MLTMGRNMVVKSLYPSFSTDRAVSHISLSVCEYMRVPGMDVRLMTTSSLPDGHRPFNRDAIPAMLHAVLSRIASPRRLHCYVQNSYMRWLKSGDIAYLWPNIDIEIYQQIKQRGLTLIMERINCHRGTSKRLLDEAYARLGWQANHRLRDEDIRGESNKLAIADYVFSPSPMVDLSLKENGVPESKIISTSFGWSPRRLARSTDLAVPRDDGFTLCFVGLCGVRKGVPQILRAWEKARIKGRLLLAGKIEEDVKTRMPDLLNRQDVIKLGYVKDVGAVYRSSDAFIFPSLEEGGPLVTYEAMGCGLPVIVTPMGAGTVAADGAGGAIIVPPMDEEALVVAMRRLEKDAELRAHLGQQGRERASEFTWERVGERRAEALKQILGPKVAPALAQPSLAVASR